MRGKSSALSSTQASKSAAAVKPKNEELGIRQFTGGVMRSVLADVRAAFGPDAMILKQESNNGRIRITACSERQLSNLAPALDAVAQESISPSAFGSTGFGVGPVQESGSTGPTGPRAGLDSEWGNEASTRSRVATVDWPVQEPSGGSWWGRKSSKSIQTQPESTNADAQFLVKLDYSESVVAHLVSETDGVGLAERIARQLVEPGGPITADFDTGTLLPGAYRFIGPSGHGKTALISRLVTSFVLMHGTEGVVLLSTDQNRLGGTLKLAHLAQLLGVNFHVTEENELSIWCRQGYRLLLIDTDGEPPTTRRSRGSPIDVLVLSAVAQPRLLAKALDRASPDSVIALTQLDQAETLGAVFSVLLTEEHAARPIEWLAFGQTIDDSHCVANFANVGQWALRGVDRSGMRTNFSKGRSD